MDQALSNPRQERGLALVQGKRARFRPIAGDSYFVPSQTSAGAGYVVDAVAGQCSCPDFEERKEPCKHVFAIRYLRHELAMPDGTSVVTESIRLTYPQDWPAYNRAQSTEESTAKTLLRGLVDGIAEPAPKPGRPCAPLRDLLFGVTMKVYIGKPGRYTADRLTEFKQAGLVDNASKYNTLFKYMGKPELLPVLTHLVEESAKPLRVVERAFAHDSTSFATQTYVRWFDHKHGQDHRIQRWTKLHATIGTLTNVITAASVTEGFENDSPEFAPLVAKTAANGFDVREMSADKAYLSHANLAAVEKVGAVPFVPFKVNSGSSGSDAWERMHACFTLRKAEFLAHYHRRSNVESTFSAMKRKFGASLRSRTPAAQFNEVMLKALCHNVSTLVHAIHEFGIEPKFWTPEVQP